MDDLTENVNGYLDYCRQVRRLSDKTLKAYRCDLLNSLNGSRKTGYRSMTRQFSATSLS